MTIFMRFVLNFLALSAMLTAPLGPQDLHAQISVAIGNGPGESPTAQAKAPAPMPLSIQPLELQANETEWAGFVARVGANDFTVHATIQASVGQPLRIGPQERTFKWDDTTRFRGLEDRAAPVSAEMFRPGAGVNVVAVTGAEGTLQQPMQPLARLVVIRMADLPPLPPPPAVAPTIGPDVQPVAVVYRGNPGSSLSVTWSPDGATLAMGLSDAYFGTGPAHLWDAAKMTPRVGLNSQDGGNQLLQFSPDGKLLAGTSDESVEHGAGFLWNGTTGARITKLPTFGARALAWSPGGKFLAILQRDTVSVDEILEGYSATTGPLVAVNAAGKAPPPVSFATKTDAVSAISWDAAGYLWTASSGRNTAEGIVRWRVTPRTATEPFAAQKASSVPIPLRVLPNAGDEGAPVIEPVNLLGFSPDAALLAGVAPDFNANDKKNMTFLLANTELRIWDTATGQVKAHIPGAIWNSKVCAFAPKNEAVAIGSDDGAVTIFDLRDGTLRHRLAAHKGAIHSLAWSPDGKVLATTAVSTAPFDGAVRFWDAGTGALRFTLFPLSEFNRDHYVTPASTLPPPEWLALAPDGSMDASPDAGTWLRWQVGEKLWPWESYSQTLRHPGLAAKLLTATNIVYPVTGPAKP